MVRVAAIDSINNLIRLYGIKTLTAPIEKNNNLNNSDEVQVTVKKNR